MKKIIITILSVIVFSGIIVISCADPNEHVPLLPSSSSDPAPSPSSGYGNSSSQEHNSPSSYKPTSSSSSQEHNSSSSSKASFAAGIGSGTDGFVAFGAGILDCNIWRPIYDNQMGREQEVPLVVGSYRDYKPYTGEVTWTVEPIGVLVFVEEAGSVILEEGNAARGIVAKIRPVSTGSATVYARDAYGNLLQQAFEVVEYYDYNPAR